MKKQILFVGGSNPDGVVRRSLEQSGFEVLAAQGFERAIDLMTELPVNLVVVDLDESGDAVGFLRRLHSRPSLKASLILALGKWGSGQPSAALAAGADAYEPTPIAAERLVDAIERILNKRATVVGMN